MVLIGLLLLALVCLALGLVLTSSAWLIASIIASAGAGILLWRTGSALASGRKDAKPAADAETAESAADASAKTTVLHPVTEDANREVWVIDGRPRYHLADCAIIKGQEAEPIPYSQATEDGFMPCSLCEPNAARTAS
jgi:hypothetical protein